MSTAKECQDAERVPLFERADLARSVELVLMGDPQAADILAQLFESFRQAIEDGLRGINEARDALSAAVEICYLHSQAHAAAVKLYRLSVEGQLRVEDEPVRLIGAAIERGTAKAAASKSSRRGRR